MNNGDNKTNKNGKPIGYFKFLLVIDCETTGICFNSDFPFHNPDTGERHQAISWGIVVADVDTLKPIDELYVEIKWNDSSKAQAESNPQFGKTAEKVHGLTREYLEEHGVSEEDAVRQIGTLIMKYWGPNTHVRTMGHNTHLFDMPFLRDMFNRYGIYPKFGNRHYDTNSIGFATFNSFTSDQLFDSIGLKQRDKHNALEDAKSALTTVRMVRFIYNNLKV